MITIMIKEYTKQVMEHTVAHHPLTNASLGTPLAITARKAPRGAGCP